MKMDTSPKRDAILAAAFTQFGQYGFRRTSMDDISKEMGISRASLYSYFENKEEIFRSLSMSLHEGSLENAQQCLDSKSGSAADLASRMECALLARIGPFQKVLTQSPHGGEIDDENNRLCGDLVLASRDRFLEMLAHALKSAIRAGEINLKGTGLSASAAAELLYLGATGLKLGATNLSIFEKRLKGFVQVFLSGLRRNEP